MPIVWNIDAQDEVVVIRATGAVTADELTGLLDALVEAGRFSWPKLLDVTDASAAMTPDEVLAVAARVRDATHAHRPGPLALVLPERHGDVVDRLFGVLAVSERPMRIFRHPPAARRWLRAVSRGWLEGGREGQPMPQGGS